MEGLRAVAVFDSGSVIKAAEGLGRVIPGSEVAKWLRNPESAGAFIFMSAFYDMKEGVACCPSTYSYRMLLRVAHEVAHHVLWKWAVPLMTTASRELGEAGEIVRMVVGEPNPWWPERWPAGPLGDFAHAFLQTVMELGADYMAFNYFLLLNTTPAIDVTDVLRKPLAYYSSAPAAVSHFGRGAKEVAHRLAASGMGRAADLVSSLFEKLEGAGVRMPALTGHLHLVASGCFRWWPKIICTLLEEGRYDHLFDGFPRDELRRQGVPMFE